MYLPVKIKKSCGLKAGSHYTDIAVVKHLRILWDRGKVYLRVDCCEAET